MPITRARQQEWTGTPLACAARAASGLFLLRRPRVWSRASRSVGRPHPPPSPRHPIPRTAQQLAAHRPAHRRSEIEKQRASSCRGRACTVAICQSTSSLRVACHVPSGMPWCFVLPYIRVKHASWFRALACVCPQTSPRRALSSLCVAVCRESVVSRDSRFVCAHGCRSSDGCGSQNC